VKSKQEFLELAIVMSIDLLARADDVVVKPPLSQAVGYVVVVVIGLVIAFGKNTTRSD
jgi:hypothetical protein